MKQTLLCLTLTIFSFCIVCRVTTSSPCDGSDWDVYKDEKCFKLIKKLVNEDEAEAICNQERLQTESFFPTLVSIKSATEQEYLTNFVFNISGVKTNVWIGAKRRPESGNQYVWNDGSVVDFTNWAEGSPSEQDERDCVQMQSSFTQRFSNVAKFDTPAINGKWVDVTCETGNWVLCQKLQTWSFPQFQKSFLDTRRELENVKKQLDNMKNQLEDTRNQLSDTRNELNNTRNEIDDTRNELDITRNELDNTRNVLDNTRNELDNTRDKLDNTRNVLDDTRNQLNDIRNKVGASAPAGAIAFFARKTAPTGWLKANGATVSRTTYADLFVAIGTTFGSGDGSKTFGLPDLRSEFIRGWSDGRVVDKGRTFGSFQWGSNIPLAGYVGDSYERGISTGHQDRWTFAGSTFDDGFEKLVPPGATRNGTTFPSSSSLSSQVQYAGFTSIGKITSWNVMKGTRPRNVALLACIKY